MSVNLATWNITLDTSCPVCEKDFDMLDVDDDFWHNHHGMHACETGSDRAKNVETKCPKCGHEFTVDLEY